MKKEEREQINLTQPNWRKTIDLNSIKMVPNKNKIFKNNQKMVNKRNKRNKRQKQRYVEKMNPTPNEKKRKLKITQN